MVYEVIKIRLILVKRIVQLWFVLAVAIGIICAPVQAMDPEEESDKPGAAASATRGSYQVVQNDVAVGVNAHNVVNFEKTLDNTDLATGDKPAVAASAGMDNLLLSDSYEIPDQKESKQLSDLEKLPQIAVDNIVRFLPPRDVGRLAKLSKEMLAKVNKARLNNLKLAVSSAKKSLKAPEDPTGKKLPNMGLPFFKDFSKIEKALDNIDPQHRKMALKNEMGDLTSFAVKASSQAAHAKKAIEGMPYQTMYRFILETLGEGARALTYVQKSALQHQFLGFNVYFLEEAKKSQWQEDFLDKVWAPEADDGLLAFINNTYQVLTAEMRAIDTDHYWVVRYGQLRANEISKDHINQLLTGGLSTMQPTIIIDYDLAREVNHTSAYIVIKEYLPKKIHNLVITNANEFVTNIGKYFLNGLTGRFTNLTVAFPAAQNIGAHFLSNCNTIEKLQLYLPIARYLEGNFLCNCRSLAKLELNMHAVELSTRYYNFRGCPLLEEQHKRTPGFPIF